MSEVGKKPEVKKSSIEPGQKSFPNPDKKTFPNEPVPYDKKPESGVKPNPDRKPAGKETKPRDVNSNNGIAINPDKKPLGPETKAYDKKPENGVKLNPDGKPIGRDVISRDVNSNDGIAINPDKKPLSPEAKPRDMIPQNKLGTIMDKMLQPDSREPKSINSSPSEISSNENSEKTFTRTPEDNGTWSGERGDSDWHPDRDYTPPEKSVNPDKPYSNPDNLTWGELLDKYGIDRIPFKNGFPDFSEVSKGTVEIEGFETGGNTAKTHNFNKADIELAKQKGCSPEEVAKWRKEHNYTWHECEDKKTMQKVPNEIHANVPHDGGRSQKE